MHIKKITTDIRGRFVGVVDAETHKSGEWEGQELFLQFSCHIILRIHFPFFFNGGDL